MLFTRRKVTVVLAFVLLFSITSPVLKSTTASAAKKTYGMVKVQTDFLDEYWPIIHKLCEKSIKNGRGDSDYELAAQVGLESGHLTSNLARDKNNCLGINAYSTGSQSAYEHASWFDSIEDCLAYHTGLMVKRYKTAAKNYKNPYVFVDCIAGKYAPGSDEYKSDIKNLISKYALYNSQRYTPKIKEIEDILANANEILLLAEKRYRKATEEKTETDDHLNYRLMKDIRMIPKSADYSSILNVKAAVAQREIKNIKAHIADWKKDLKKAKKKAYSTFHTIALGINYGYISASRENLGDAYDYVMEEYEKLS